MSAEPTISAAHGTVRPFERSMPPVVPVAMASLSLAVVGGVIVSAGAGLEDPSLVVPTGFVAGAVLFELVAVVMAATIRPFAWDRFRLVFGWSLLAYVIQSAMIVFAFVRNQVPAGPMAVLAVGLVVFATDVPLMIAFTVARYQAIDGEVAR